MFVQHGTGTYHQIPAGNAIFCLRLGVEHCDAADTVGSRISSHRDDLSRVVPFHASSGCRLVQEVAQSQGVAILIRTDPTQKDAPPFASSTTPASPT
ncbi:hypothetical protein TMatcc_009951 [Talaromyces marneffei ATCC 18224]